MVTNYDTSQAVLAEAGLPDSENMVDLMVRWMAAEEPPTYWWHNWDPWNVNNLLAGGQESFPNLDEAIAATAAVLRQSNMAGIYAVLRAQGTLQAFSAAVVASPWSADHYGGNPDHIAQIPVPPEIAAPGTPPSPNPPIPPIPKPPPDPKEYEIMDSVVLSDGTIVSHAAGTNGHYYEITRKAGTAGSPDKTFSIIDVTDLYGGGLLVAP